MSVIVTQEPLVKLDSLPELQYPQDFVTEEIEEQIQRYQCNCLAHDSILGSEECDLSSREIQVLNAIREQLGWCVIEQNRFYVTLENDMGGMIRLRLHRNVNGSLVSLKSFWEDPITGHSFLEVRCRHIPVKRIADELFSKVCSRHFPMLPANV